MSWGMGDALVVPNADGPAKYLRDHLRKHLASKFPDISGFALRLDEGWEPDEDGPYVVVFDDSGPVKWPVETRPTLRVVVWSHSLTTARQIAGYALGVALSHHVDGLSQVLPGTAVLDARDTTNGGIMASFTVRTRVRTTLVVEPD